MFLFYTLQNIGFDIRGDLKLFDFGLAKELKPSEKEGQDQFHTSGLAGTRRYMAPEVAQVMPYGKIYFYVLQLKIFSLEFILTRSIASLLR